MKFFLPFLFVYSGTSWPIADDRIIFPDEDFDTRVDDSPDDIGFNQLRLLTDKNLLKSDNNTKEFLYDEQALQKLENGQFYQGDIVLMPDQVEILNSKADDDEFGTRTGLISEYYRWPKNKNGKVIVPYSLSDDYTWIDRIRIYLGMRDLEKYTCVYFKSRESEPDYVYIKSEKGCSSNLGKLGGRQVVSLQRNGCLSRGTIIHELIHSLGYDHMHSHSDRDAFVTIVWGNIDKKTYNNFDKVDGQKFSNFGTPYDFYSVMHYSPTAFTNNGKRTIVPKEAKYRNVIGQRVGMSPGDAERINNMYKC